ncbi:MAG: small multi-drug export protein [Nanoarchaeota archaeon]|nr:small multi-drug export protein [Nanoarchaeota archaeon]
MDLQIFIGLILTVLPFIELRGGLPVIVDYAIRNGQSIWPYFFIVVILNILVILLIFMFFDLLHEVFMRMRWYQKFVGKVLARLQKRVDRVKERMDRWGYFALILFVGIPLPITGAWSGSLIAWALGLNRWKSFLAISAGVVIAGLLVLFASFGLLSWLN